MGLEGGSQPQRPPRRHPRESKRQHRSGGLRRQRRILAQHGKPVRAGREPRTLAEGGGRDSLREDESPRHAVELRVDERRLGEVHQSA